ncbi:MAG TPA: hypothetical protein DEB39_11960 [Planctomycetaceae bacterium]|nr:hypothetical protein [Planctomycetaceae bacterium]
MRYSIRLAHPDQVFRASHAIRYVSGGTEDLHEHTFRVVLTIFGPLNGAGYVVDFVAASRILRTVLGTNAGKIFRPEPRGEEAINPPGNPTAETLARSIVLSFYDLAIREHLLSEPVDRYRCKLELEEEPGMWAVVET